MDMYLPDIPKVEVCFSPSQYDLYRNDFDIAVVIDVLRATSAIATALEYGVEKMIPVSTVEEARELQKQGLIAAAERNGEIVDGFDLGNSPIGYMDPGLKGKTVALTTTNGTRAINIAAQHQMVVIGALVNLGVVCDYLVGQGKNVLLLGSGWKNKFNLEDTICAGAIADHLIGTGKFQASEDSTIAAKFIYRSAKENIFSFLKASSHRRRLRKLNLNEDVKYCLTPNTIRTIPVLKGRELVKLETTHVG